MNLEKKPLIILTGPTAVGKTDISISLAKVIDGEIISADSMQVYKYMDIGSAKISKAEMCGINHYLVDVINPDEEFNVVIFQKMAKEALKKIYDRGKIPIVVGGTGFYIQALLYDIDFDYNSLNTGGTRDLSKIDDRKACEIPYSIEERPTTVKLCSDKKIITEDSDSYNDAKKSNILNINVADTGMAYRIELENLQKTKGSQYLHDMLRAVDIESADTIHPNNVKRVIRALEYFHQTGNKISVHNRQQKQKESPYNFLYFVLNDDRKILYERINKRVDIMLEKGLIAEVELLAKKGYTRNMVSMQGLGYKEMLDYLSGLFTYEEAVEIIKRDTRHFAKRQLTWFKREKDVIWIDKSRFKDEEEIVNYIISRISAQLSV